MAQSNDNQEILSAMSDMSFLPKEAVDENYGRSFPKIHRNQNLFRLVFLCITAAAVIAYLVCLFVFGTRGYYYPSNIDGSYGITGILVTAIFALVFLGSEVYGYFYDVKLSCEKDEKKLARYTGLNTSLYYLSFVLLYGMFMTTILRHWVFEKAFSTSGWFVINLGVLTFILLGVLSIIGVILAYRAPNVSKIYNYVILALGLWVVVFFGSVLTKSYSLSSHYGIVLLVMGGIMADLATIALMAEKKTGMRSTFHVLLTFAFVFEALTVLIYGMAA